MFKISVLKNIQPVRMAEVAKTKLIETKNNGSDKYWPRYGETEPLTLLLERYNCAAALESYLAFSFKTKYAVVIGLINFIPRHLSQIVENLCSHKNIYEMFFAAVFVKPSNWKQSKMSFIISLTVKRKTDWHTYIRKYCSAIKRNMLWIQTATCWIARELQRKEPISKSYRMYDSIYVTVLK